MHTGEPAGPCTDPGRPQRWRGGTYGTSGVTERSGNLQLRARGSQESSVVGLPTGLAKQKPEHMPSDGAHPAQLPKAKRRVERVTRRLQGAKISSHLSAGIISVITEFKNYPSQT